MKIKDIMTPNASAISQAATLADASRRMRDLNVGVLPVVEGRTLKGIITDRDIVVRGGAQHWNLTRKLVGDAMTPTPVCCEESDEIAAAVQTMETAQIRRLPVLNAAGDLVGMVSLGDVALRAPNAVAGHALAAISHHGELAVAS